MSQEVKVVADVEVTRRIWNQFGPASQGREGEYVVNIAEHDVSPRERMEVDDSAIQSVIHSAIDDLRKGQLQLHESVARVEGLVLALLRGDANGTSRAVSAARFTHAVSARTPEGAQVAVISRGDQDLLRIPGCTTSHFPRTAQGAYPWFYPSESLGAIAHLEAVRMLGTEFLAIPASGTWWLESFPAFGEHLTAVCSVVFDEPDVGTLFDLRPCPTVASGIRHEVARFELRTGRQPSIVDWETGLHLADRFPDLAVATPPRSGDELPYLDRTIDLVLYRGAGRERESLRVAGAGAIDVSDPLRLVTSWHTDSKAEAEPAVHLFVLSSPGTAPAASLTIQAFEASDAFGTELAITTVAAPSPPRSWLSDGAMDSSPDAEGIVVVVAAGGLVVGGCGGLIPLIAAAREGVVAVGVSSTFEGIVDQSAREVLVVALGRHRLHSLGDDVIDATSLVAALGVDRSEFVIERSVVALDCREAC